MTERPVEERVEEEEQGCQREKRHEVETAVKEQQKSAEKQHWSTKVVIVG